MAGAPSSDELIGRATELAAVRRVLATTSEPAVIAVTGDPGIGKSRILNQLCTEAAGAGYVVVRGSATEFERHLPFGALVESFDDWQRTRDRGWARFGEQVGELLRGLSAAPDAGTSAWFGLHRRIRTLLEDLARPRGLVLVLDDVHWADDALVELIGYLLRWPPRSRFVLALGYRPRQVDSRVLEAVHGCAIDPTERLELGPLSNEEAYQLAGQELSRATREYVVRESGGNPLFLTALRQAAGTTNGLGVDQDEDLPTAVHAAFLSEIRGLTTDQLEVVQAAAIARDPFEYELVAAIADVAEGDVVRMVDELVKRDLIRQVSPAPRFGFRHPLLRRLVYTSIPAGIRRDAHRRAAARLRADSAAPATIAHHIARSATVGDLDAAELLADGARATIWQAPASAAWLLEEALRLLSAKPGTTKSQQEWTLLRARALVLAGRLREGREVAHTLLTAVPEQLHATRAEAAILTATVDRLLGQYDQARAVLLGELDRYDVAEYPETACLLRIELVTAGLLSGDFAYREGDITAALAAAARTTDRSVTASVAAVTTFARYASGRYEEALEQLGGATAMVDALADAELGRRLDAVVWLAWAEVFLERFDSALIHFDRALTLIRSTGQGQLLTYVLVGISQAHGQIGRFSESAEWAADAVQAAEQSASDELRTMAYTLRCLSAMHLADLGTALDAGARAVAAAGPVSDWWAASAGMLLGQAKFLAGADPEACLDEILRAGGGPDLVAVDPGNRPYFYEFLVLSELARGDTAAALAWVDRMDAAVARLGPSARYRAGMAQLLRAETLLETAPLAAVEFAQRALESFTAARARFFAGRAHLVAGRAMISFGERKPGLAHVRRAQEIFTELGVRRLIDETIHLTELTSREAQIARLVADGRTNRQIAQHLLISIRTVETHVRNIRSKLEAPSRTAIAATVTRSELAE